MNALKTINIDGESWTWPRDDEKLQLVFKHRSDIHTIMNHVKDRSLCIQAGGATGVWPIEFAKYFDVVLTFEPDSTNYAALRQNVKDYGAQNVVYTQAALGDNEHRTIKIIRDPCHIDNYGAGYAVPGGSTPVVKIDTIEVESCGLIQLDVEGYELRALKGAYQTILMFKPVIVLEVKHHPQLNGRNYREAADYLITTFGYKETARFNRDILFTYG